jgi:peptidoglycan/LPS O-acetylase OafA/YrhL
MMQQAPFITRPMSIALDAVRALAALAVLFGHTMQITVYDGYFPYWFVTQHNAVLIFFVLSGLVIATSADKPGSSLENYAMARAVRLLPVALPAVLISAAVDWHVTAGQLGGHGINGWLRDTLLATVFLSSSFGHGLPGNAPYWSLCYEVWFYAIFAAAFYLRGGKRIAALALCAVLAGPAILLLLPGWLAGVWLARTQLWRKLSRFTAWWLLGFGLAGIVLVVPYAMKLAALLSGISPWKTGYSEFALSDWIVCASVALAFLAMRVLIGEERPLLARCERPIRYLAGMSFSLYLLHWPVITLLNHYGIKPLPGALGVAAYMAMITAICAVFAHFTEHRRDAARRLAERIAASRAGRSRPAPAA